MSCGVGEKTASPWFAPFSDDPGDSVATSATARGQVIFTVAERECQSRSATKQLVTSALFSSKKGGKKNLIESSCSTFDASLPRHIQF